MLGNKTGPPDTSESCVIGEQWHGTVVVISAGGEIDLVTAPHLEAAVAASLAKAPSALIIDLSAVEFLASHGMTVLIKTRENVSPEVKVLVVADGPATSRPLKLVGVSDLVPLFATLDEALAEAVD